MQCEGNPTVSCFQLHIFGLLRGIKGQMLWYILQLPHAEKKERKYMRKTLQFGLISQIHVSNFLCCCEQIVQLCLLLRHYGLSNFFLIIIIVISNEIFWLSWQYLTIADIVLCNTYCKRLETLCSD